MWIYWLHHSYNLKASFVNCASVTLCPSSLRCTTETEANLFGSIWAAKCQEGPILLELLLMEDIRLTSRYGSLSHYLQGFIMLYTSQVVRDFFHQQHSLQISKSLYWWLSNPEPVEIGSWLIPWYHTRLIFMVFFQDVFKHPGRISSNSFQVNIEIHDIFGSFTWKMVHPFNFQRSMGTIEPLSNISPGDSNIWEGFPDPTPAFLLLALCSL